jgi:quinol monooxygenase YgiN
MAISEDHITGHHRKVNHAPPQTSPIVELRQYRLHPGKRDALIDLFEREFIESQEALGMAILGTFRDLDDPDRFVWVRGFADMTSRARGLNAFYSGPVWQAHRDAANATMVDSDDVLLLRVAGAGSSFASGGRRRPPPGASAIPQRLVVANIYYFASSVGAPFIEFFERAVSPALFAADIRVGATYVSETSPNDFPRLPVRENERVFVWFSTHRDARLYEQSLARLRQSAEWVSIREELHSKLMREPEVHRLQPTPRSALRD